MITEKLNVPHRSQSHSYSNFEIVSKLKMEIPSLYDETSSFIIKNKSFENKSINEKVPNPFLKKTRFHCIQSNSRQITSPPSTNFYLKSNFERIKTSQVLKENLDEYSKPIDYDRYDKTEIEKFSFHYDVKLINHSTEKKGLNETNKTIEMKNKLNLGVDPFESNERLMVSIENDSILNDSIKINVVPKDLGCLHNKFKKKENSNEEYEYKNNNFNNKDINEISSTNRLKYGTSITEFGESEEKQKVKVNESLQLEIPEENVAIQKTFSNHEIKYNKNHDLPLKTESPSRKLTTRNSDLKLVSFNGKIDWDFCEMDKISKESSLTTKTPEFAKFYQCIFKDKNKNESNKKPYSLEYNKEKTQFNIKTILSEEIPKKNLERNKSEIIQKKKNSNNEEIENILLNHLFGDNTQNKTYKAKSLHLNKKQDIDEILQDIINHEQKLGQSVKKLLKIHGKTTKLKSNIDSKENKSPFQKILKRFADDPSELESEYDNKYFKKNRILMTKNSKSSLFSKKTTRNSRNTAIISELSLNTTININNSSSNTVSYPIKPIQACANQVPKFKKKSAKRYGNENDPYWLNFN